MILDPKQDPLVFENAYAHKTTPDWEKVFEDYDAAVDWPAAAFWKDLLQQYPDTKVILTTIDSEQWYTYVSKPIQIGPWVLEWSGRNE